MSKAADTKVRPSAPQLEGLIPYDPRYLQADIYLSANENPYPLSQDMQTIFLNALQDASLNRYPDPLCKDLRMRLAEKYGVKQSNVLVGNGGDELLFNLALGWGGPGRRCMVLPPTFSVYENNARLTNTEVIMVPRNDDFSLNENAVLQQLRTGNIDICFITSPNNPTGNSVSKDFLEQADRKSVV